MRRSQAVLVRRFGERHHQRITQGIGCLVTLGRILSHRGHYHLCGGGAQGGNQRPRIRRRLGQNLCRYGDHVVGDEWALAGEQGEQRRTQGVDIAADVDGGAAGLLGTHESGRADQVTGNGQAIRAVFSAGQSQVGELGGPIAADEDVRRLEIAV